MRRSLTEEKRNINQFISRAEDEAAVHATSPATDTWRAHIPLITASGKEIWRRWILGHDGMKKLARGCLGVAARGENLWPCGSFFGSRDRCVTSALWCSSGMFIRKSHYLSLMSDWKFLQLFSESKTIIWISCFDILISSIIRHSPVTCYRGKLTPSLNPFLFPGPFINFHPNIILSIHLLIHLLIILLPPHSVPSVYPFMHPLFTFLPCN